VRDKLLDPDWYGVHGACATFLAQLTHAPGFYRTFLTGVALPNVDAFAFMVAWGETLVGVALLLGLLSRAAAAGGLFLLLNYWLGIGGGNANDGWFNFDVATFMMTVLHAAVPTGIAFGLDGVFRRIRARRALSVAEA
jgi:uncharacterized membrane protein YphA (DoxX/SURF4 family)